MNYSQWMGIYRKSSFRFMLWLSLCILLFSCSEKTVAQETPQELNNLYARSAVLMDGDSGRVLFGKNEQEVLPMASTTKIMTCILALELASPEELCEVSEKAASQPQVHLGMRFGESYYLKDLLYSMMLESHNDSAVCVAEHVGGSVEDFARLMNKKAAQIGCEHTHYVTPNGLDGEDKNGAHSTTAEDLAKVMRYCISQSEKSEEFLTITRTAQYSFQEASGNRSFTCVNHNALLSIMEGALSGKTGFTGSAGYCYVGAVRRGNETLIVALLACGWPSHKTYKWTDTAKLVEYGFSHYEKKQFDLNKVQLPAISVHNGVESEVPIQVLLDGTQGKGEILLLPEETIQAKIEMPKILEAPVNAGDAAGSISCMVGDWEAARFTLVLDRDIERINFRLCLKNVLKEFFF